MGRDRFQNLHRLVAFAGVEQGQGAVVAGEVAVQPGQFRPRTGAAERVDDEGKRHLIQPGVHLLTDQSFGRVQRDFFGIGQKTLPEGLRVLMEKPTGVEVKIALPVFVGLGKVE